MKTLTIIVAVLVSSMAFAVPHGHTGHRPGHGPIPMRRPPPPPRPMPHHHVHCHSPYWFLAGLGTGILVDALRPTPPPPPPVVVGPVVHQRVWVPPVYETRPVLDAYGRVVRYEQVLVRPGYWQ